jgi:multiple sugar transport system ATP-binding protein
VDAEIVVVEPTGAETQMHVKIAGQTVLAVFKDRLTAHPGDRIKLLPAAAKAMLFDPTTGLRIG